ncbi:MAG: hypothetical protein HPZ91_00475 [Lentisphaeria bacterium]|nr:hypothetical protein [Lentisphaeria bacterium]
MKKFLFVLAVTVLTAAHALDLPRGGALGTDGVLTVGDAKLALSAASTSWQWLEPAKWREVKSETGPDFQSLSARIQFDGVSGTVSEKIRETGKNRYRYEGEFRFPDPVNAAAFCCSLTLPQPAGELRVDGRKITIPEVFDNRIELQAFTSARSVEVELNSMRFTISGKLQIYVQDDRRWSETVSVRIYCDPPAGSARNAKVEFDLAVSPVDAAPVDLAQAAGQKSPAAHALDLPRGVALGTDGVLTVGDAKLALSAASTSWQWLEPAKWREVKSETGPDFQSLSARIQFDGVSGTVSEKIRETGKNRYRYEGEFRFPDPVNAAAFCCSLTLPQPAGELRVDGRKITIPEVFDNRIELQAFTSARSVEVELNSMRFTISGKLQIYVQDDRRWSETVSVRIYCDPPAGSARNAKVEFDLAVSPVDAAPVDLAQAANRTFSDPDGSGWTGQGKHNDMAILKPGNLEVGGLSFLVREGRGAIVVGRRAPDAARLVLPPGAPAGAVNLLHASAWTPKPGETIGLLEVNYAGGRKESIPVKAGIDCGNWWISSAFPNAAIAFKGDNESSTVGLYASSFPLSGEKPESIVFRAADPGNCMWMIAGVTLSSRPVKFPARLSRPVTVAEGMQWKRFDFERRIVPGSPLDFSGLVPLDAPAGKYGFVRSTEEGEFSFENAPERKIRFYGVNLCFSANYLDKKSVDDLVEYFVRMGYNTVRLHHQDDGLTDPKAPDSLSLDPAALDKLDYLFARLKERGIYITTDLYVSRQLRKGDGIVDGDDYSVSQVMKALLPINRKAMENWKEFARRWMKHKNPYTGLTWGEDPALITISLVNEETLSTVWSKTPETARLYREKFEAWKAEHGITRQDQSDFSRFLSGLQGKALDEQIDFVKNELGMKALVTSLNFVSTVPLTLLRSKFDLVDNHLYFSHPSFPERSWYLPQDHDQGSAIRRGAVVPGLMMPTRIFGKPFTVTEFNYCNPNVFRAEGGPLMGACAALQGWSGLWRFAWSHDERSIRNVGGVSTFDAVNDPMQQFSDRIILALFLRGDLVPAQRKISYEVPQNPFRPGTDGDFPNELNELGLAARIGSHVAGQPLPPGVEKYRPGMKVAADPQLRLDRKAGTLAVVTDLTETVTLPGGALAARTLRVKNADRFMTVGAISRDGRPLAESKDILVIHLTNISGNNAGFSDEYKTRLLQWGKRPLLIERGTAELEFASGQPWRVAALASDGSELGEVKGEFGNGLFRFKADTGGFPGGVAAYHLTR